MGCAIIKECALFQNDMRYCFYGQVYKTMLDAHFLKKKIQFERMKERMKERIIEEEDDSSDGETEPDIKVENINDNKNKVSAEMMKLVNEATKNEVKEGTDEDVANDVKKMNETNLVTGAELNRNVNLRARDCKRFGLGTITGNVY